MQLKAKTATEKQFASYIYDDPQPAPWLGDICIPMPTALACIFSEDGLVIAADGLNLIRTSDSLRRDSDRVQKIFHLSGIDREVACSFFGRVTLLNDADEMVFNFIYACQEAAKSVRSISARDASEFAAQICPLILEKLESVKEAGKLSRYPKPESAQPGEPGSTLVRIFVDGYFNGQPHRTGIRVFHVDQKLGWDLRPHDLSRWRKTLFYGARRVANLLFETNDPRLEKYRTDACKLIGTRFNYPDTAIGLEDAVDAARNFIGACSDPLAKEIEGDTYQRIGGEVHIATITPNEGFRWRDRPKHFEPLSRVPYEPENGDAL